MTTSASTSSEGFNQSVRLRPQAAETDLYEYRCEKGHLRTPANTTVMGHCRTCTVLHPNAKRSRWTKHKLEVKPVQNETEQLADFYFSHHQADQKRRAGAEQVKLDRQRQRESQERKTRDAQSAAFDLMDASMEEQSVVTKRLGGRNCLASLYVAEIRRLRELSN